jgi:hypothetical protein
LIAGVFLAYGLAISVVTYSVKKQRGCTTVFVWLKLILSLIIIDIVTYGFAQLLREIGICHWNLHFTNWFILGFSAALCQAWAAILFTLVCALLSKCIARLLHLDGLHISVNFFYAFGAAAAGVFLLAIIVPSDDVPFTGGLYASVIFNCCFFFGGFFGPLALTFIMCKRWGVTVSVYEHSDEPHICNEFMPLHLTTGESSSEEMSLSDSDAAPTP